MGFLLCTISHIKFQDFYGIDNVRLWAQIEWQTLAVVTHSLFPWGIIKETLLLFGTKLRAIMNYNGANANSFCTQHLKMNNFCVTFHKLCHFFQNA